MKSNKERARFSQKGFMNTSKLRLYWCKMEQYIGMDLCWTTQHWQMLMLQKQARIK